MTLEPLLDAVRAGLEDAGWELSGLQKTTSHQFEGRWEGESTRSAYLFMHSDAAGDFVSIDVYLDETTRGLTGNIALVVDLAPLHALGSPRAVLARLSAVSASALDRSRRRPITLRLRVDDAAEPTSDAEVEVRFKVRLPKKTIAAGAHAVRALAIEAANAFGTILAAPELRAVIPAE